MQLAQRVQQCQGSQTVQLTSLLEDLQRKGEQILSLNVGEPDFPVAPTILQATQEALAQHKTRYSHVQGLWPLRKALQEKMDRETHLSLTPENILITNGSKQAIYQLFQCLCDPGDEVIIPVPYWVTFPESVKLAGGVPVFLKTNSAHQVEWETLERAWTPRTKAFLINSPHNPTGVVYPRAFLEKVADFALQKGFYLISDEAYEHLTYDGLHPFSIASLSSEVFQRTLTLNTFSKTYAMTGFRVGSIAGPLSFIQGMTKLQGHTTGNVCTFAQYGAISALQLPQTFIEETRKSFEKKRDLAYNHCASLFPCERPQGAFYLFPDISSYLGERFPQDADFASFLLREAKVAVVPGSAFGQAGYLRISFANSENVLTQAFQQMRQALQTLPSSQKR
jgi:aspartate aminotransferase